MDWKDLGQKVAQFGLPLLGAVLPIPGGAAIGAALASAIGAKSGAPDDIMAALTQSADAQAKARQFELDHQHRMLGLQLEYEKSMRAADTDDLRAVNETMRVELANSAAEAWYQKAWRPFNGFVVGAGSFVSVVYVCVLFHKAITSPELGMNMAVVINTIPQLASAVAMILAVPGAAVGIAAWNRGKMKLEKVRKGNAQEAQA